MSGSEGRRRRRRARLRGRWEGAPDDEYDDFYDDDYYDDDYYCDYDYRGGAEIALPSLYLNGQNQRMMMIIMIMMCEVT